MNKKLEAQIRQTWATHFRLPAEGLTQIGTTLFVNSNRDANDWLLLWHIGPHTVVELAEAQVPAVQAMLDELPDQAPLTAQHLLERWGELNTSHDKMYAVDAAAFAPAHPAEPYTVRQLTLADQAAFDQFQARCSEEERDEGEIGLDHELAVGVLHGERIIAGASMYAWRGSSDIGVLVDPAYRRQGLGAAVSSFLIQTLLEQSHERVIIYRHQIDNLGSQGVAQRMNLPLFGTVDAISPPPLKP